LKVVVVVLGWCISSCSFLTLSNNLFFTQIIKQSINYVFSSIIHDCLPMFGQVLEPSLEEIHRFGREEVVEPILEHSIIVEGNYLQIVGESGRGGNLMGQGPEGRVDVEESPSRVPEWLLPSCLQCVVWRCHSEESLHVVNPGVFAGLLPPGGEVVDSIQQ
jgi:hypothetical protein